VRGWSKNTARVYHRLATVYDKRWQTYLQETLDRALRTVGKPEGSEESQVPLRFLDVGCGTGEWIRKLLTIFPRGSFVGVDPALGMIEEARKKFVDVPQTSRASQVEFLCAPAEEIPFSEGAFDWVTCCNALHCFSDAAGALYEMGRVLKSQGKFLLMDWCRDSFACKMMNLWCASLDPAHVWMYTVDEIRQMLEDQDCSLGHIERFRVPWPWKFRWWEMGLFVAVKGG